MHPNKHIREALAYAEKQSWQFAKSRGHAYGRIRCDFGHRECQIWIWSTPRNPESHARRIRKIVDSCPERSFE
ncbi:MAG: hypothetical protein C0485_18285 [Pirellula sp.]|nr:hypothetical protein [Pirellula sp.]